MAWPLVLAALVALVSGCDGDPESPESIPAMTKVDRSRPDACDRIARAGASPEEFVSSLRPGETGCLMTGTYGSASGRVEIAAPGVTLRSYPDQHATLLGTLVIEPRGRGVTVSNLILNGESAGDALSPLITADEVVLRDNEITNDHTGICVSVNDAGGHPAPRGVVIEGNRIHDCGVSDNHQHGIYLAQARETIIRDNWIYANADRGIQLYPNADGTRITGNVIDGNGEGIIFAGTGPEASDDNLVEGNVITNPALRYNIESYWQGPEGTGNVVRENCLWTTQEAFGGNPSSSGILSPQSGFDAGDNVVVDPRYVDRAAGDFRMGSPCPVGTGPARDGQ